MQHFQVQATGSFDESVASARRKKLFMGVIGSVLLCIAFVAALNHGRGKIQVSAPAPVTQCKHANWKDTRVIFLRHFLVNTTHAETTKESTLSNQGNQAGGKCGNSLAKQVPNVYRLYEFERDPRKGNKLETHIEQSTQIVESAYNANDASTISKKEKVREDAFFEVLKNVDSTGFGDSSGDLILVGDYDGPNIKALHERFSDAQLETYRKEESKKYEKEGHHFDGEAIQEPYPTWAQIDANTDARQQWGGWMYNGHAIVMSCPSGDRWILSSLNCLSDKLDQAHPASLQ